MDEADYYFINRMVAEGNMAALIDIEALAGDAEMVKEFVWNYCISFRNMCVEISKSISGFQGIGRSRRNSEISSGS